MATILTINLSGKLTDFIKLRQNIKKNQAAIIALQDVPMVSKQNLSRLTNGNTVEYEIVTRHMATQRTKLGTAILLHKRQTKCLNKEFFESSKISAIAIKVNLHRVQKHDIEIINVYIRPRASFQEVEKLLDWVNGTIGEIHKVGNSNTIICGDFNASSPLWAPINMTETTEGGYDNIKASRGRLIERMITKMRLKILNPNMELGGSFVGYDGHVSHIDLIAGGEKVARKHAKSWYEQLGMDKADHSKQWGHRAVVLKLRQSKGLQPKPRFQMKSRINYKLIKADQFIPLSIETNPLIGMAYTAMKSKDTTDRAKELMNQLAMILYKHLLKIQANITELKRDTTTNHTYHLKHDLNAITRRRIRQLIRLEEKLKQRNSRQNRRENQTRAEQMKRKIIKGIRTHQARQLTSDNSKDLWTTTKQLLWHINLSSEDNERNPVLASTSEQLNAIAEEKFPLIERGMAKRMDTLRELQLLEPTEINDREVEIAIWSARAKKYKGPEGLRYQTLLKTIDYTREVIKVICKLSFWTNEPPDICKDTLGMIIPKKAPGTYRIVHVGTPLANLLEQIALHRLESALEEGRMYNTRQYGFIANRGRQDLVARVLAKAYKHRYTTNYQRGMTVISLDIQGAFDNVDQDGIIEKLLKELWPNPLRLWLANYIASRRIRIEYNKLRSESRHVCRGVPQGSPLGPILWNYTINQIDEELRNDNETEVLAYADDLIIVDTSECTDMLQTKVEMIVEKLDKIKLKVKAEKSSLMVLKVNDNRFISNQLKPKIYIGIDAIKETKTMNILGVRISNKGKLDTKDETYRTNIEKAIRKLYEINHLDIIYKRKDWLTLIEAYLASVVQQNNVVIMSIDKGALIWADKTMAKAARTIFGWPSNVSIKVIQTITGIKQSKFVTVKALMSRIATEHSDNYKTLIQAMQGTRELQTHSNNSESSDSKLIKDWQQEAMTLSRRYHNPDIRLTMETLESTIGTRIVWLIIEQGMYATGVELITDPFIKLREIKLRHATYPVSYFNAFSLIWTLSDRKDITNRQLLLSETNSIYLALKNEIGNHDWRTILLRERLARNNWSIIIGNTDVIGQLKEKIRQQQLSNRHTQAEHEGQDIINTLIPNLDDYYLNNYNNKLLKKLDTSLMNNNSTRIMRTISNSVGCWTRLSPCWITSKTTLMLTGLCSVQGTIRNGEIIDPSGQPTDCAIGGPCKFTNNTELDSHITIHRATNCIRYTTLRDSLMDETTTRGQIYEGDILRHIRALMEDGHKAQVVLRLLTEAAFLG